MRCMYYLTVSIKSCIVSFDTQNIQVQFILLSEKLRFTSELNWGLDTDGYWPLKITVFRLRISCRYICDVDRIVYIKYVHSIIMWWIDVYNYKQALVRSICEININTVILNSGCHWKCQKVQISNNFGFYCISTVFKGFLLCLFYKFGFC